MQGQGLGRDDPRPEEARLRRARCGAAARGRQPDASTSSHRRLEPGVPRQHRRRGPDGAPGRTLRAVVERREVARQPIVRRDDDAARGERRGQRRRQLPPGVGRTSRGAWCSRRKGMVRRRRASSATSVGHPAFRLRRMSYTRPCPNETEESRCPRTCIVDCEVTDPERYESVQAARAARDREIRRTLPGARRRSDDCSKATGGPVASSCSSFRTWKRRSDSTCRRSTPPRGRNARAPRA